MLLWPESDVLEKSMLAVKDGFWRAEGKGGALCGKQMCGINKQAAPGGAVCGIELLCGVQF